MSKKKNTLKDLDEFLKQQAATLVTPAKLSDTIIEEPAKPVPPPAPVQQAEPQAPVAAPVSAPAPAPVEVSAGKVLADLKLLAQRNGEAFRKDLYDIIIQSVEVQPTISAEDKMLINTALYLKSGSRWKEVIREYWRNKSK